MPICQPLAITIATLLALPVLVYGQAVSKPASTTAASIDTSNSSTPAAAATSSEQTDASAAIVITGSNIKRTDYEGPQTVKVIDRQAIDRSGVQTITQLINRLPENSAGFSEAVNVGNSFSPGASAASLRGLGVSATLILINGRRVAPFGLPQNGTDAFVDLNGIPLDAVERVEILKEGASAIYGSDAIAGVINIILKDNYSGGEFESTYGNTTRKDASEFRESALSGFQNERFHIMVSANYLHQDSIAQTDRSFSSTADLRHLGGIDQRSSIGNPGTIFTDTDTFAVPPGSNGHLGAGNFLPGLENDGSVRNKYDFNKNQLLTPETERWGGLLTFGYNITPHIEGFLEASFQEVETKAYIAPTPADETVPASNPFNPFGQDVESLFRSVETGNRLDDATSDTYRFVTGLKFKDLPKNWSAEASYLYSENDVVDRNPGGYLSDTKFQAALADTNPATSLNVFGDGDVNSRRTLDRLLVFPHTSGVSYLENWQIKGSGELFNLWGNPVSLALGAEFRREYFSHTFSDPEGSIIGFGGSNSAGGREVESLFVEGDIPLVGKKNHVPLIQELELTAAERYDHYSDFGESTKPKFGFKYKPFDGLLFRGAYAEGFRAPTLPQLFTGTTTSFEEVVDPRNGQASDAMVTTGGDPHLKPENSYSYFLGGIVEPPFIKGFSVELDFFHIQQRNLIDQPDPQDVVDGLAPGTVTRGPGNTIANVSNLFTNLGEVVTEGEDLDVSYKLETRIGTFTFDAAFTYYNEIKQSNTAGAPLMNMEDSNMVPDFKMIDSIFYRKGGFEIGVTLNFTDSYDDTTPSIHQAVHKIGNWTTVDLQASYEWVFDTPAPADTSKDGKTAAEPPDSHLHGWRWWLNHTKVTLGCNNIGDSQPPFADQIEGYDTQTADATGRFVYASLRKKFW